MVQGVVDGFDMGWRGRGVVGRGSRIESIEVVK
jgi:hypothetical protein